MNGAAPPESRQSPSEPHHTLHFRHHLIWSDRQQQVRIRAGAACGICVLVQH
jgi:hypothetical protein